MINGYEADQLKKAIDETQKEPQVIKKLPCKVLEIDQDGTVWVAVPGGVERTPLTSCNVEAIPGHVILVEFNGIQAIGVGDETSPSASVQSVHNIVEPVELLVADASRDARIASEQAEIAKKKADEASESAAKAEVIVDTLNEMAEESGKTVEQILEDAGEAGEAAAQAKQMAKEAAFGLSDIEKIIGTVNWIAEHGEYVNQAGQEFDPTKIYYVRTGEAPNYIYKIVADPVPEDIDTYYILKIDESVQNFIAAHLWLDEYGLNVSVTAESNERIHIGTFDGEHAQGVHVISSDGEILATFALETIFYGESSTVKLSQEGFSVFQGEEKVLAAHAQGVTVGGDGAFTDISDKGFDVGFKSGGTIDKIFEVANRAEVWSCHSDCINYQVTSVPFNINLPFPSGSARRHYRVMNTSQREYQVEPEDFFETIDSALELNNEADYVESQYSYSNGVLTVKDTTRNRDLLAQYGKFYVPTTYVDYLELAPEGTRPDKFFTELKINGKDIIPCIEYSFPHPEITPRIEVSDNPQTSDVKNMIYFDSEGRMFYMQHKFFEGDFETTEAADLDPAMVYLAEIGNGGTIGQSTNTEGASLKVPYVKYDAKGRVTGGGTHNHSVISTTSVTVNATITTAGGQAFVEHTARAGYTCVSVHFETNTSQTTNPLFSVSAPVLYGSSWRARIHGYAANIKVVGTMYYHWIKS